MAYACNMDPLAFRLHIATAASDIGTGTYTILAQSASEAFGIPIEMIDIELGDSTLPECPTEGSSWTAASAGAAVWFACQSLREKLFKTLGKSGNISAWLTEGLSNNTTMLQDGFLQDKDADENLRLSLTEQGRLEVEETAKPGQRGTISQMRKARFTHSAVFCEVRVDEELGLVRVTRLVNAVAAGRIMNPKTAASQVRGAMVMATGITRRIPDGRTCRPLHKPQFRRVSHSGSCRYSGHGRPFRRGKRPGSQPARGQRAWVKSGCAEQPQKRCPQPLIIMPPFTCSVWPVTKDASSLAR
ncbi:MAG: molybdopterin cofactor-binding domain-containing protein [Gluconobacter potus]